MVALWCQIIRRTNPLCNKAVNIKCVKSRSAVKTSRIDCEWRLDNRCYLNTSFPNHCWTAQNFSSRTQCDKVNVGCWHSKEIRWVAKMSGIILSRSKIKKNRIIFFPSFKQVLVDARGLNITLWCRLVCCWRKQELWCWSIVTWDHQMSLRFQCADLMIKQGTRWEDPGHRSKYEKMNFILSRW